MERSQRTLTPWFLSKPMMDDQHRKSLITLANSLKKRIFADVVHNWLEKGSSAPTAASNQPVPPES
ncbi:hypothetical protein MY11210_009633 [Beauveria gryllotalpidicola]